VASLLANVKNNTTSKHRVNYAFQSSEETCEVPRERQDHDDVYGRENEKVDIVDDTVSINDVI